MHIWAWAGKNYIKNYVSRHHEGRIKHLSYTPQYDSAVMEKGFQGVSSIGLPWLPRGASPSENYTPELGHFPVRIFATEDNLCLLMFGYSRGFKSYSKIRFKSDLIYHFPIDLKHETEFCLLLHESKKGKCNLISVALTRIKESDFSACSPTVCTYTYIYYIYICVMCMLSIKQILGTYIT